MKAHFDIAISGTGLVGLVVAIVLKLEGFDVALVGASHVQHANDDNRAIAIMNGQWDMIERCGIVDRLASAFAPLEHLTLVDATERLVRAPTVTFHASDIGEPQFARNVSINTLMDALWTRVKALKIDVIAGQVEHTEQLPYGISVQVSGQKNRYDTKLLIAADGKHSISRTLADISARIEPLGQTAMSFTIEHALPHDNHSYELHKPHGPLTFVPIQNPHHSNVIWTVSHEDAARLQALNASDFAVSFTEASHSILGDITLKSSQNAWSLSILQVSRYGYKRTALVGDASHAFPPIGAQGFNLGLRDVRALVDAIKMAHTHGLDIGNQTTLDAYSNNRKADIFVVTSAVRALNSSLLSSMLPAQCARAMGLLALDTFPNVRDYIMKTGMVGV